MAKLLKDIVLPQLKDKPTLDDLIKYLGNLSVSLIDTMRDLHNEFNGKVETINLRATVVTVADTGNADTEFSVTHNLGVATVYYIPQFNAKPASTPTIYVGTTTWTSNIAYLKSSVANCNITFLVIA